MSFDFGLCCVNLYKSLTTSYYYDGNIAIDFACIFEFYKKNMFKGLINDTLHKACTHICIYPTFKIYLTSMTSPFVGIRLITFGRIFIMLL